MSIPKVFISYSWDEAAHKNWVRELAIRLRQDNVETILDQWHAAPGDQLPRFMDQAIRENDFVLIICTPKYKTKADNSGGGVGYEGDVIQGHVFVLHNDRKFIPVLRKGEWSNAAPSALLGKYYIDLRDGAAYENNYRDLLLTLRGERETPPPLGARSSLVYLPDFHPENFISRSGYVAKLRDALVDHQGMFLLSGEPGSGKSTLAMMFAWEAQKDFDAVVFQTCGQRTPEAIVSDLAETLRGQIGEDVATVPPEKKLEAVKKWLKQRRSLLVLDDVWLTDPQSTLHFQDLIPGLPVSVLFTSRRPQLPWLGAGKARVVESFTVVEVEAVFKEYLGAETAERHREALLQFAQRMDRLPIAVTVGADMLRSQFGPLDETARRIALANLRNEIHDVPALLRRAIEAQGELERCLLTAAAVCVQEGFWLPLAIEVAGLSEPENLTARDNLVNASLVRVLDRERQRFQLHALLWEQLRTMAASLKELHEAHAQALEKLFVDWERRWKDCRECLPEIIPAAEFLWSIDFDRESRLTYNATACARRIGELDTALRIQQQRERLWSGRDDRRAKDSLRVTYGFQGLILKAWGRLEEALALYKKQEAISLELGSKADLQVSYGNQANILHTWGRLEEAMALHKKKEAICLELGNKDELQRSYGNQALILYAWGRLDEAMALHKKKEAICLELGNKDELQRSYGNQALILYARGRLDEAMALHKKKEAICLELGNKDELQRSYGNQALILKDWGHLEEALALHKKQETICLELGNRSDLAYCYWNWGLLARKMKDPTTENQKLQVALAIFTELKMPRERDAVQAELNGGEASAAATE
jgi:tetratricopeptide (TPR) repeat protein